MKNTKDTTAKISSWRSLIRFELWMGDFEGQPYEALEIIFQDRGTGRYYCCELGVDKNTAFAVGYCAENCLGHESRTEAFLHYVQFLIERKMSISDHCIDDTCHLCSRAATKVISLEGFTTSALCDQHCHVNEIARIALWHINFPRPLSGDFLLEPSPEASGTVQELVDEDAYKRMQLFCDEQAKESDCIVVPDGLI